MHITQVAESASFPPEVVLLAREKLAELEGTEVAGLKVSGFCRFPVFCFVCIPLLAVHHKLDFHCCLLWRAMSQSTQLLSCCSASAGN